MKKTHDSLGRRVRTAGKQPTGKVIRPSVNDAYIFDALDRHHLLATPYIYKFSPIQNYQFFRDRLGKLYHEASAFGPSMLDAPFEKDKYNPTTGRGFVVDTQPRIYELGDGGKYYLNLNRRSYVPTKTDHLVHRFLTSCVSASFELMCQRSGYGYIPANDIFSHPKCPPETLEMNNPLGVKIGQRTLIPDELFGIDYGNKRRFFALELDRATESIRRTNKNYVTIADKLDLYTKLIERRQFQEQWGITNLTVLIATTTKYRIANMQKEIKGDTRPFLFKSFPFIGTPWLVPDVLEDVFSPWQTVDGEKDISVI